MISSQEALQLLKEGNQRYANDESQPRALTNEQRRALLEKQQAPYAVILGCSDSRVPAEIIFDQGLGDLFVIRVAGNIVAPSQVGSIEYAVETFGTPLVVVLGHSNCGAINATLDVCCGGANNASHNVMSIVSRIRPAVETLCETDLKHNREELAKYAVRANVRSSVSQIRYSSPILERLMQSDQLVVIGAEYSLATGAVTFYDSL